jgi:hypothetical protein
MGRRWSDKVHEELRETVLPGQLEITLPEQSEPDAVTVRSTRGQQDGREAVSRDR